MKTKFLCPHCRATLSVNNKIIFRFRSQKQVVGIMILDPKSDRYVYLNPSNVNFEKGEKIEFICPVCCQFLKTKGKHDDLVELILISRGGIENRVFFSSKAGKHTKFYIGKKSVIQQFS